MKLLSSTGRGVATLREDSELFVPKNTYDEIIDSLKKDLRGLKKGSREYEEVLRKIREVEEQKKKDKKPNVDYKIDDNIKTFRVERAYVNTVINRYNIDDKYVDVYVAYGKPIAVAVSNDEPERKNPSYLKVYPITDEEGYEIYEKTKDKEKLKDIVVNYSLHLTDGKEQFIYNVENLPLLKPTFIYKNLRDKSYHDNKSVLNSLIGVLNVMNFYNKDKIEKHKLLDSMLSLQRALETKEISSEIAEAIKTQLEKIEERLSKDQKPTKEDFTTLRSIEEELKEICINRIADINIEFSDKIVENGFAKVKKPEGEKIKNYRIRKSTSPSSLYGLPDFTMDEFEAWIDSKPFITFARNIDINNPEKDVFSPAYVDTPVGVYGVRGFWMIRGILNYYLYNKDKDKNEGLDIPKNFNVESISKYIETLKNRDAFYKDRGLPKKDEIYKAHVEADIKEDVSIYLDRRNFAITVSKMLGYEPLKLQQPQQQENIELQQQQEVANVMQAKPVVDSIVNSIAKALSTEDKDVEVADSLDDILGETNLQDVKNIVMRSL